MDYLLQLGDLVSSNENQARRSPTVVFPDFGVALHRGRRYGVAVAATTAGASAGGHHHCDKGSVLLSIAGVPVLVDAGTFCYTGDLDSRSRFRSTAAHNVAMIDAIEQPAFEPRLAFSTPAISVGPVTADERSGGVKIVVSHSGYFRVSGLGVVKRTVSSDTLGIRVEDTLYGEGTWPVVILFHFHPDVFVQKRSHSWVIGTCGNPLCRLLPPRGWQTRLEPYLFSAAYRQAEPAACLRVSSAAVLPCTVAAQVKLLCCGT